MIMPGVRVGRDAVVAVAPAVTHGVESFEIGGGVPARRIGTPDTQAQLLRV